MGNHVSHGSTRVILPDGTVTKYNEPVTVAELMLDHPQQVVIELRPVTKKPKPLAADFRLENNKVYLMVPLRRGPMADMPSEKRQILLKSGLFLSACTGFIPLFVKMWLKAMESKRKAKVSENPPTTMMKSGSFREVELVLERMGGYYLKTSWKPSLDTINENGVKPKMLRPLHSIIVSTPYG